MLFDTNLLQLLPLFDTNLLQLPALFNTNLLQLLALFDTNMLQLPAPFDTSLLQLLAPFDTNLLQLPAPFGTNRLQLPALFNTNLLQLGPSANPAPFRLVVLCLSGAGFKWSVGRDAIPSLDQLLTRLVSSCGSLSLPHLATLLRTSLHVGFHLLLHSVTLHTD